LLVRTPKTYSETDQALASSSSSALAALTPTQQLRLHVFLLLLLLGVALQVAFERRILKTVFSLDKL
jgi:hypothetical protein